MSHQIEARDGYVYMKMTSPRFEFHNTAAMIEALNKVMTDNRNLVINCAAIAEISDDELFRVKQLFNANRDQAGFIVIAELKDELIPELEMIGITCLPTDDEAADYIYMEQLERDLLNMEDEE